MSRSTKIVLAIIAGLLVTCLCLAVVGAFAFREFGRKVSQAVVTDPTQAASVSQDVAAYDLPAGYTQTAIEMLAFDMIYLTPDDTTGPMFTLMQFPASANMSQEQMEQQMDRSLGQRFGQRGMDMKVVESREYEVRGEQVTMTVRQGNDASGAGFRQMTGVFPGNNGQVLLMVMGEPQAWDQEMVDGFIGSIR